MTKATEQQNDREFFEAVIARWELSLALTYEAALDVTGDDDLALTHVVDAMDRYFDEEILPPAPEELVALMTRNSTAKAASRG